MRTPEPWARMNCIGQRETGDTGKAMGPTGRNCRCCRDLGETIAENIWEAQKKGTDIRLH